MDWRLWTCWIWDTNIWKTEYIDSVYLGWKLQIESDDEWFSSLYISYQIMPDTWPCHWCAHPLDIAITVVKNRSESPLCNARLVSHKFETDLWLTLHTSSEVCPWSLLQLDYCDLNDWHIFGISAQRPKAELCRYNFKHRSIYCETTILALIKSCRLFNCIHLYAICDKHVSQLW